jgi:transketolase
MKQQFGTTRDGFGKALFELGFKNVQIIALCADLSESMRVHWFKKEFPERFLEMGVQEENMVGMAAGLSLENKITFACSYSVFLINNALGPIRASLCYSNANVKLIGGHAGITTGQDGATHQALEDIATLRVLPNMTVIVPADEEEARQATYAISKHVGPCYLRIGKYKTPIITSKDDDFKIGKAKLLHEGADVTIVACGNMVNIALAAAKKLCHGMGGEPDICVDVINMHTIKPIDAQAILKSLKKTNALITIEEHQIIGGLGSAVLEVVATNNPQLLSVPAVVMGVNDTFGQSGTSEELLHLYKLDQKALELEIKNIVNLKKKTQNER